MYKRRQNEEGMPLLKDDVVIVEELACNPLEEKPEVVATAFNREIPATINRNGHN